MSGAAMMDLPQASQAHANRASSYVVSNGSASLSPNHIFLSVQYSILEYS